MANLKLGRKPAVHTLSTLRRALAAAWHLDKLRIPPTVSTDWVKAVDAVTKGNWGMDGNDNYGDCVFADCSHQKMLWTANVGPSMITPTTQDTLALYSAVTGFDPNKPNTDNGADIITTCNYLENTGYLGTKLDAYAPIDPNNSHHVKWGVQLFGSIKLGLNLPSSAEDQFSKNQPWHVVAHDTIVGGHDVPLVKYDAGLYYVVTWGKLQGMSPNFLIHYCDEAIIPIAADWISKTGAAPSGLNLASLLYDLGQLRR